MPLEVSKARKESGIYPRGPHRLGRDGFNMVIHYSYLVLQPVNQWLRKGYNFPKRILIDVNQ